MRLDAFGLAGLLALAAALPSAAPFPIRPLPARAAPDSGAFVIRHSADTVAVERFARTPTSLEGILEIRNSKRTSQSYQAVVTPDASVPMIEVTVREDEDSGRVRGKVVHRARIIFKEDSAAVDDLTGHGLQTRILGTERGAVPYLNLSFALLEQAVLRARAATAARQVPLFNLGGGQTLDARLTPLGRDSMVMAIGDVEFHLRVAPDGRVLGGRIPAQDVVAERTR